MSKNIYFKIIKFLIVIVPLYLIIHTISVSIMTTYYWSNNFRGNYPVSVAYVNDLNNPITTYGEILSFKEIFLGLYPKYCSSGKYGSGVSGYHIFDKHFGEKCNYQGLILTLVDLTLFVLLLMIYAKFYYKKDGKEGQTVEQLVG